MKLDRKKRLNSGGFVVLKSHTEDAPPLVVSVYSIKAWRPHDSGTHTSIHVSDNLSQSFNTLSTVDEVAEEVLKVMTL